jgi:serine/threonine protein kinase HipA of HipAB toxin-antitoxin module
MADHIDNPLVGVEDILDGIIDSIEKRVKCEDYAEEWQSLMGTVENIYEDTARALSKLNVCYIEKEVKDG